MLRAFCHRLHLCLGMAASPVSGGGPFAFLVLRLSEERLTPAFPRFLAHRNAADFELSRYRARDAHEAGTLSEKRFSSVLGSVPSCCSFRQDQPSCCLSVSKRMILDSFFLAALNLSHIFSYSVHGSENRPQGATVSAVINQTER